MAAHRRNAKDCVHFQVCPPIPVLQIGRVRRILAPAVMALLSMSPLWGADAPLARYDVVAIKPGSVSLFIATVTVTIPPFVRRKTGYSSTYSARVFPYFFWSEKGRIWIDVSDDTLRRLSLGETIYFVGHATNDSGDERKVEGHATPTGPAAGKIWVRVSVSKRIGLNYESTYDLTGAAKPRPDVTPK
jgi:hypothetical protein